MRRANQYSYSTESDYYDYDEEKGSDGNDKKEHRSICYQIKIENPILKWHRFYLMNENEILYMAKQRFDDIYIGEGNDLHIKNKKKDHSAKIKRDNRGFNIVETKNEEIKINFHKYGQKHSISVSFDHNGKTRTWQPLQTSKLNHYAGEYNHQPKQSPINTILKNQRNRPTLILRKMSINLYEVECRKEINPIVVFSIALSQIVGPF